MGRCCKIVLIMGVLLSGWAGYNIQKLFQVPPIPRLNLNQYWGPGQPIKSPDTSIRPFAIEFEEEMLSDLKSRLKNTKSFTKPLEGVGFQYGFNTDYLKEVLEFWATKYDFSSREKYLNQYPQFVTNIQGLDIHFLHIKPKNVKKLRVIPLLLLHGWPGSVLEFYKMIPSLVTPKQGKDFIFEVIVPSLPGYGYSQGASKPGLGDIQMAVIMKNLMSRLNFSKFVIQGGDWGSNIGSSITTLFPDNVIGFHTNFASVGTVMGLVQHFVGSFYPPLIIEKKFEYKMYPFFDFASKILEETGYLHLQATKPDTIGIALLDSPAGLAAYILEKFSFWTNSKYTSLKDGGITKKFTLTELLDNIMLYWDSQSITTSVRLYAETINPKQMKLGIDLIPTQVPTAIARFENEVLFFAECQYKTKYPNLVQLSDFPEAGHFAAFEEPKSLSEDLWKAVEKFNDFYKKKENKNEL